MFQKFRSEFLESVAEDFRKKSQTVWGVAEFLWFKKLRWNRYKNEV